MNTQVGLPLAKQQSIARKPIGRKAIAAPVPQNQNDHNNSTEPFSSKSAYGPSQPNSLPCELPGSPVRFQSDPNRAAPLGAGATDVARPPSPQCTLEVSPLPSNGAKSALDSSSVSNERGMINEAPVQSQESEIPVRSDGQGDAVGDRESTSTSNQSKTNQARRLQRRTMMLAVTANIGTTQTPAEPFSLGERLLQPGYGQSAAPALSSRSFPQAGSVSQVGHTSPTRPPAPETGSSMPFQPSIPISSQAWSGMAAQNSLSPNPFAFPSRPIQNSALPGGSTPRAMPFATLIQGTSPPQGNQATQQFHNLTSQQIASWSATSSGSQMQTAPSPTVVFSSVQNRPPAQRSMSMQSAQTVSSVTSLRSAPNSASSVGSPITNVTTPSTVCSPLSYGPEPLHKPFAGGPDTYVSYFSPCSSCKIGLNPGTSFFECLICASGHNEVHFCIYCYTTGAAASVHPHDPSYYVCGSDPLAPDARIHASIWTVRKNAMNRVWYQHNASRYRTYVRPMTATAASLPAGWEERQNPEGRTYYVHLATCTSSWTKPGRMLPNGWKEIKTPDGRPFYLQEEFQLSTWTWPGQQPGQNGSPQMSQEPSQKMAVPMAGKPTKPNVVSRGASAVVTGVGITAKLSTSAADIASDPFMGTTKAVTKGVMLAAKSFKNNKKARKMLSRVGMKGMKQIVEAAINAGDDGDDLDFGDDDDNEGDCGNGDDAGVEPCRLAGLDHGSNDCAPDEINQDLNGHPQQVVHFDPGYSEPQAETMYPNPFMQQGSNIDSSGQVSNSPDCYQEVSHLVDNNITDFGNHETRNSFVDQSMENQVVEQSTQSHDDKVVDSEPMNRTNQNYVDQGINNQLIDQGTQNWVDNSQSVTAIDAQPTEVGSADFTNFANTVNDDNVDNQNTSIHIPPPSHVCGPDAGYTPLPSVAGPCSNKYNSYLPSNLGLSAVPEEQSPAPFVFEPMLGAPMMVEPAASSDGVVSVPQYPSDYDTSAASFNMAFS